MLWDLVRQFLEEGLTPNLIVIGGLTLDNVISADGQVQLSQSGGNGAYSAVGAIVWVDQVGLVSKTVESYPNKALEKFKSNGINLDGVHLSKEKITACDWFIYDNKGNREEGLSSSEKFLSEAGFSKSHLSPQEVLMWQKLLSKHSHYGEVSYSTFRVQNPIETSQIPSNWRNPKGVHIAPSQPEVMKEMLDFFEPGAGFIMSDSGWQLADKTLDEINPILSRLDAFIPSETELRSLVPSTGLTDGLAILSKHCPGIVAVKLGMEGVLIWDRKNKNTIKIPCIPTEAIDPTGAGDSFCGGFLAGFIETEDPVMAAQFGTISASKIVTNFGADTCLPFDTNIARENLKKVYDFY